MMVPNTEPAPATKRMGPLKVKALTVIVAKSERWWVQPNRMIANIRPMTIAMVGDPMRTQMLPQTPPHSREVERLPRVSAIIGVMIGAMESHPLGRWEKLSISWS